MSALRAALLACLGAVAWGVEYKDLVGAYAPDYEATLALCTERLKDDRDGSVATLIKRLEAAKEEFASSILRLGPATIGWSRKVEGDPVREVVLPIKHCIALGEGLEITTGEAPDGHGGPSQTMRLTSKPPLLILEIDGRPSCLRKVAAPPSDATPPSATATPSAVTP